LKSYLIGVISDTHGLLRPEAENYLAGSNFIIHAGDIGNVEIISKLIKIAPVEAICGNIDNEKWAEEFQETLDFKIGNKKIFVIHNIKDLNFNPVEKKFDIIISGHSHKALIKKENEILYLNPGSAGKRRFNLPISIAKIQIIGDMVSAKIIEIDV
jgi:putative phosphoesterase